MRINTGIFCAGVMFAVAVPLAALGSHGKVGLWENTVRTSMPNMSASIPPEALARMKAMGMSTSGNHTYTTQHCMTAEEVAQDTPPTPRNNRGCSMTNVSHDAHTFTADLVCSGEGAQGRGHVEVTYDSNERYAGTYAFNGTMEGHPQTITSSFEGRWISADCGSVK
ncbi:MAG TPA: DUF3617 domain-containing protein [Rhizomicrobium sp.]|nr:DUF3617 domain-containing protein [Rhizomicrobium sp.]